MSFKKSFFKNVSSYALYNYITQALEFLSTIILSRLLFPEEYGFVAIILIFSGFIQLFSDVGIGASVIRSDYGYTFHRHLQSLSIWLGLFLASLMMLSSYPIAILFNNTELTLPIIVISFRLVFDSFTYISYAILSKQLKFKKVGIAKLYGTSFQIGLTIIMAFLGFSYWSLIIPLVLGPIMQYAYLRKTVKLPLRFFSFKAALRVAKRIRSLMGNLTLSNLITYWSSNADKVIIARLYTQSELGLYNRAFRFIMISSRLVTGIFGSVLFPSLKQLMTEKGNVNKEYLDILRVISLLNIPIILPLALFPEALVLLLWGQTWIGVAEFLPYIAVILMFKPLFQATSSVYILYGKERNLMIVNLIKSVTMLLVVVLGGMISIIHMILFISIGTITINLLLHAYLGFYKSFAFKIRVILSFWMPMMLFGLAMVYSIYFPNIVIRGIVLFCFAVFLIFGLRKTLGQMILSVKSKLLKRSLKE